MMMAEAFTVIIMASQLVNQTNESRRLQVWWIVERIHRVTSNCCLPRLPK